MYTTKTIFEKCQNCIEKTSISSSERAAEPPAGVVVAFLIQSSDLGVGNLWHATAHLSNAGCQAIRLHAQASDRCACCLSAKTSVVHTWEQLTGIWCSGTAGTETQVCAHLVLVYLLFLSSKAISVLKTCLCFLPLQTANASHKTAFLELNNAGHCAYF